MAITLVQTATNFVNNAASVAKAYTSNVTAGNLLLVIGGIGISGPAGLLGTPTDTLSNTWTRVINSPSSGDNTEVNVYWAIANASGANTVTLPSISGSGVICLIIAEYSGIANPPVDASHTPVLDGVNTGSITTTVNGDLIIAVAVDGGNNNTIPGTWSASGYTIEATASTNGGGVNNACSVTFGDQIQSTAGSISATFVDSTGNTIRTGIVGFFAGTVAPVVPSPTGPVANVGNFAQNKPGLGIRYRTITIPEMNSFDEVRQVMARAIGELQNHIAIQLPVVDYKQKRISNVAPPVAGDDVVTLKYLESVQLPAQPKAQG